jgi:hypothetical protein
MAKIKKVVKAPEKGSKKGMNPRKQRREIPVPKAIKK